MVTTAKSSNHHSRPSAPPPAQPIDGSSPKFWRKNLSSPWAQVVCGGEPESVADINQSPPSPSSSSSLVADQLPLSECSPKVLLSSSPVHNCNTVGAADCSESCEGNVDRFKKPIWKKPSNGVECGPVMGAESWPALSVSTKGSAKLSAESSSKTVVDGSLSTSQGPMTSQSSSRKQVTTDARHNSVTNYNGLNRPRPRPMRRVSGNSSGSVGPSQSNFSNPPLPPPPPPFPVYQLPPVSYGNMVSGTRDPVTRDQYWDNNWDARPIVGGFMPIMNEYQGSSRRGYFGPPHPRGDGSYHNSRRDDRGNYVSTRDAFLPQSRMPPRGLLRHPPPSTAATQPIGSYANPMGFSEFYYYRPVAVEQFTGVPYFTHGPPPATYFSAAEPLSNLILKQIEYYFCDDNLVRDEFLKSKMDDQGWVPVTLIADFPRVRNLTSNIQLILDSLRTSLVVEVQGDKLRRKNEWSAWVLAADSGGSVSPLAWRHSNLTSNFQNITLEETTKDESSTESSTQSQLPNGSDGTGSR
ncbi:la-related protein 1C [Cajanus cajan]|uniref:La-related protein 1 n=1 Tax=Cajanus cajan TaxID=3821 RepID=A0A151QXV7_CAJCA|nr:la-related protein 1C [Cajanus cajan]KYP35171.1 La-related protein 1 [Cajanus cajan]